MLYVHRRFNASRPLVPRHPTLFRTDECTFNALCCRAELCFSSAHLCEVIKGTPETSTDAGMSGSCQPPPRPPSPNPTPPPPPQPFVRVCRLSPKRRDLRPRQRHIERLHTDTRTPVSRLPPHPSQDNCPERADKTAPEENH